VAQRLSETGLGSVEMSPMVRGRLLSINMQAVSPKNYEDARAKRLVDREFNLSYTDTLPSSNDMVDGRWLNPQAHEVSLEEGLAQALGIRVNDSLTFDVSGRPVQGRVSGLSKVACGSCQATFFA